MKKVLSNLVLFSLCFVCLLSGCNNAKKRYYSSAENYIHAKGIVEYLSYNEDGSILYVGFSDLTPQFDDSCFKIVGESLLIAQERGIDQKLKIGDQVDFITAPKYFGDGYVMPMVELTVCNEMILEFEEGYESLLKWLS